MYADESGDCGMYDATKPDKTGSKYFILTGVFVHVNKWKIALETLKAFRKKIACEGFLAYDVEFHCAEMIDPHKVKAFTQISVKERWALMEEYAEIIGQTKSFKIISVVIDKTKSSLTKDDYLTTAVATLYEAFDEFLKSESTYGLVFLDRANEKTINTHVRKLLGTGARGETAPSTRIAWIIEDPIFRVSHDSMFIQTADLIAYTLKEKEFPTTARKKFNADRIFGKKLSKSLFQSKKSNDDGIIRV